MKFDFNKTFSLVKGGLLDHRATWEAYLGENPAWRDTLITLTGPMIVANVVLSVILSRVMGTFSAYSFYGNFFTAIVLGLVLAALGFTVAVLVFNYLAGMFGGKPDFSRAFAAISLAAIPAWIAGIIGSAIPWLGGLVTLAGGILSLVFIYRILPLAVGVPDNKRVVHFVVSLVAILIVNLIIGRAVGMGGMAPRGMMGDFGSDHMERDADNAPGMFGEIGRQADIYNKANESRYEPPSDGEVSEKQAEWMVGNLNKSRKNYEEEMARLKKISDEIQNKDDPSPADLAKMYQGMGSAISLSTIETETVMAGGGNWAEYQWVKSQLRAARLQRGEGSGALEHNFEIYQDIEDELGPEGL